MDGDWKILGQLDGDKMDILDLLQVICVEFVKNQLLDLKYDQIHLTIITYHAYIIFFC